MFKQRLSFWVASLVFVTGFATIHSQEALPSSFSRKVVIEEYTGAWCGYCPDGTSRIRKLLEKYPGQVFAASYHDGDKMEAPGVLDLAASLGGLQGVPTAAVNRLIYNGTRLVDRGSWPYLTDLLLSGKTNTLLAANGLGSNTTAGIRLNTSLTGNTAEVDAFFGFLSAPQAPLAITVLVLEDGITGYPQSNYMNTTAGSEWKGKGAVISDFVHDHVARKFVTAATGDSLSAEELLPGIVKTEKWTFTIDPSWKKENLHILVFLHFAGKGKASQVILNAQSVKLGQNQGWD